MRDALRSRIDDVKAFLEGRMSLPPRGELDPMATRLAYVLEVGEPVDVLSDDEVMLISGSGVDGYAAKQAIQFVHDECGCIWWMDHRDHMLRCLASKVKP